LYVKSYVETFFSVNVMGKYVIQTQVSYDKEGYRYVFVKEHEHMCASAFLIEHLCADVAIKSN